MSEPAAIADLESAIETTSRAAFRTGFVAGQLAAIRFVNTIKCGTHIENLLLLTVAQGINALEPPIPALKP